MDRIRRGFIPSDTREFQGEGLALLQKAAGEVTWLLDQEYDMDSAVRFVGEHHKLSLRQRSALRMSLASSEVIWKRRGRRISTGGLEGQSVLVDGINTLLTMEAAFTGGTLLRGRDGCVRDLAELGEWYHIQPETEQAVLLTLAFLKDSGVRFAVILLSRKYQDAEELKALIEKVGSHAGMYVTVAIHDDPEREMLDQEFVISTNPNVIDRSKSWYALTTGAIALTGAKENVVYTGKPLDPEKKWGAGGAGKDFALE